MSEIEFDRLVDAVRLLAAQNTAEQHSTNASSGASLGVSIGGGSQSGVSLQAGVNKAKGRSEGVEITYTNTRVSAGNAVRIASGGDTTLSGATVAAHQVAADVGGGLAITSVQDRATYDSKQQSASAGVSLCLPPLCYGASSVSGSFGKSKIDSNYQSVAEQTAIKAGDSGFTVKVQGDTSLTGAAITSTQAAIAQGKNRFTTGGTLAITDQHNTASYQGSAFNASASFSGLAGDQGTSKADNAAMRANGASDKDVAATSSASTKPSGAMGMGRSSASAQSTTTAGISAVAGDQSLRTGDQEAGIGHIFDADKVQKALDAQVVITAQFGSLASQAVGDYADAKVQELRAQGRAQEAEKWEEGGAYRSLAHALIGGLTGGTQGALGAGAAAYSADAINKLTDGLPEGIKNAVGAAIATGIGAAAGGASVAGAATAFNADVNNRQLHPDERQWAKCHIPDDHKVSY